MQKYIIIILLWLFLFNRNAISQESNIFEKVWHLSKNKSTFKDFHVFADEDAILISENYYSKDAKYKSRLFKISYNGSIINEVNNEYWIWYFNYSENGKLILMKTSIGTFLINSDLKILESFSPSKRVFFLKDDLILTSSDYSNEEGFYAFEMFSDTVCIKKINEQVCINKFLFHSEIIASNLIGERLFLISRGGPIHFPDYYLSVVKNIYRDERQTMVTIPLTKSDYSETEFDFINDSLLICADDIYLYDTDGSLQKKNIQIENIEGISGDSNQFLWYGGNNILVFTDELGKIKAINFIGFELNSVKKFLEIFKNYKDDNIILYALAVVLKGNQKFVLLLDSPGDNIAFFKYNE